MPPLLRLLRPHQYTKNLLVFAAPGAAGRLDEAGVVASTLLAFVLFCTVSSGGYVLNDMFDVEADRQHPVKRFRPLANGDVTERQAISLLLGLGIASVALAPLLGWSFLGVLLAYALLSSAYSTVIKQVPWLELLAVSAGFVLRAVAGGAATDIPISGWFLLVVSAGALLVIIGKRLGELNALGARTPSRSVLARYRIEQLRVLSALAGALAVGGYAAWAAAEANDQAADSGGALLLRLTAIPFAAAIGRYLVLAWRGSGETPESLILRDRIMVGAGLVWAAVYAVGLYV